MIGNSQKTWRQKQDLVNTNNILLTGHPIYFMWREMPMELRWIGNQTLLYRIRYRIKNVMKSISKSSKSMNLMPSIKTNQAGEDDRQRWENEHFVVCDHSNFRIEWAENIWSKWTNKRGATFWQIKKKPSFKTYMNCIRKGSLEKRLLTGWRRMKSSFSILLRKRVCSCPHWGSERLSRIKTHEVVYFFVILLFIVLSIWMTVWFYFWCLDRPIKLKKYMKNIFRKSPNIYIAEREMSKQPRILRRMYLSRHCMDYPL